MSTKRKTLNAPTIAALIRHPTGLAGPASRIPAAIIHLPNGGRTPHAASVDRPAELAAAKLVTQASPQTPPEPNVTRGHGRRTEHHPPSPPRPGRDRRPH